MPLYEAGPAVIPLVIEHVKDKKMPHRLKAIAFLGSKNNTGALPALEQITDDETENSFHRKCALGAIFQIDKVSAKRLAETFRDKKDFLGEYSRCILTGGNCI